MVINQNRILKFFALIFGVLVIYLPSINGGWVWDDIGEFEDLSPVKGGINSLVSIWFNPAGPDYYPVKSTVQWVEWHLWGNSMAGYHIVTVGLHLLSALLLWRILKRVIGPSSWLIALLFSIHPIAVESVAWISELKNTLSLFFILLAWNITTKDLESCTALAFNRKKLCVILFYVLALLAKASVIMFPITVLLYIWWQKGRIKRNDLFSCVPLFAVSLVIAGVTIWFQNNYAIAGENISINSAGERIVYSIYSIFFYLKTVILPVTLIPVYPKWSIHPITLSVVLTWIASLAGVSYLWTRRTVLSRNIIFCLGYFIINLIPIVGIIPMYFFKYSWVADHFIYISLIGICILIGSGVHYFYHYLVSKSVRLSMLLVVCVSLALVSLGFKSYTQANYYRSDESFWLFVNKANPDSWDAYYNLGVISEHKSGHQLEAIEYYTQALRLNPTSAKTHNNIANLLSSLERNNDEAIAHYKKAIELEPHYSVTHNNFGLLLAKIKGRESDAIEQFQKALAINPNYIECHYNYGVFLAKVGSKDNEAISELETVVRSKPDNGLAHFYLACLLAPIPTKQPVCLEHFRRAVLLLPDLYFIHYNYGLMLISVKGRRNDAIYELESALRLNPQDTQAREALNYIKSHE
jgi:tetratricopeptide (TPR) repeat protein